MSGSPFRERRIPPEEVRQIVKRAAELAMVDAAAIDSGEALSETELVERLAQLGVPSSVTRRALVATTTPTEPAADGSLRVVREVELDGMIPPARHEDLADAIAAAMGMPGRVSVVGNKLTWTPGGALAEPAITVHSKDGRTRVHYTETLANRGQRLFGFGTIAGLGGLVAVGAGSVAGVALAKAAEISAQQGGTTVFATAAIVGVAGAVASFVGLQRAFERRAKTRSAFADTVMARVVTAARRAIEASPLQVRVGADLDDTATVDSATSDATADDASAVPSVAHGPEAEPKSGAE